VLSAVPDSEPESPARMWHVTLTVEGAPVSASEIREALERLSDEHPFLLAGRYAPTRAEVRYWDEALDASTAMSLAARLWGEHRVSAGLPDWQVVGVEVIDQGNFHRRGRTGHGQLGLVAAGRILPF
jgi:hypothetical protein